MTGSSDLSLEQEVARTEGLLETHGTRLLDLARESIRSAVTGTSLPEPGNGSPELVEPGASFVTLTVRADGALRGCVGSAHAWRPLVLDVIGNARASALQDTRFSPVRPDELAGLALEVSVLTRTVPFPVSGERELLAHLSPGRDGLVLADGTRRALFLPQVWEVLPDPADFVSRLKEKAGFHPDEWPDTMAVWRFEARSVIAHTPW